jgi:hypothetical protein
VWCGFIRELGAQTTASREQDCRDTNVSAKSSHVNLLQTTAFEAQNRNALRSSLQVTNDELNRPIYAAQSRIEGEPKSTAFMNMPGEPDELVFISQQNPQKLRARLESGRKRIFQANPEITREIYAPKKSAHDSVRFKCI